ncbi:TetR/AcrR family transcriptional regulator [Sulfitobacter sp. S190]|uniref:TetR/AcrR family transcriptional regulator n=1 Tax=Sulfitobacter sp. S190 TaxID=2867022 RepID=UPI0021A7B4B7|nr:TetR/AcrR family transcriptional regulator [Sulfitobacter sp. S190]UWR22582.1 TetR/AcrR family transcriptional regulator [Sulfitobacter sp. S190]
MARPREFEEADAIAKATQVFWTHGYQDASLPDLLEGMGLTRGSLYKAFKDKKNLFLVVLDHYERAAVDNAVRILSNPDEPDGAARILTLFGGIYRAVSEGEQRGCLLCTAASGSEMADPEIAAAVHQGLAKMQAGFEVALAASPQHADLSDSARLQLANVLVTQYVGLRMLARSRLPLGILENAVRGIAGILGRPEA